MVLQAVKQDEFDGIRLGFTVTKKMGNAVVRNRIRRRLRAVAQAVFFNHALFGYDYVLVSRKAAYDAPFDVLNRDLLYLMRLMKKAFEEKNDEETGVVDEEVNA